MNRLAIATLKNERTCLRLPISIKPLRALNVTFDSARTGMAKVGSRRRWAASTTTSAIPISFFSTAVGLRVLVAMGASYAFSGTPAGSAPSTPSGVTMIEFGSPSGPLPFLPTS